MATMNALKRAPILNETGGVMPYAGHTVSSSDPAVVRITSSNSGHYAVGVSGGTATITATRTLDGAVATLDIEVIAAVPFSISLGAESPA